MVQTRFLVKKVAAREACNDLCDIDRFGCFWTLTGFLDVFIG